MAYKSNPFGPTVDRTYPSEIAAQRPALMTRVHCEESPFYEASQDEVAAQQERDKSIRGSIKDNRCADFNAALRSGHGFRNQGDE